MSEQYPPRGVGYASGSNRCTTIEQAKGGRDLRQGPLIDNG